MLLLLRYLFLDQNKRIFVLKFFVSIFRNLEVELNAHLNENRKLYLTHTITN